jgi:hypothetical protein
MTVAEVFILLSSVPVLCMHFFQQCSYVSSGAAVAVNLPIGINLLEKVTENNINVMYLSSDVQPHLQ